MDIFKWWGHSRNVKKRKRKRNRRKQSKETPSTQSICAYNLAGWETSLSKFRVFCFDFCVRFLFLLSWEWSLAFFTLLTSLVFCCCCCLDDGERNYRTILSQRAPVFKVCGLPHQLTHVTLSADDTGKDTPNTQKPIGYLNTLLFFLMP